MSMFRQLEYMIVDRMVTKALSKLTFSLNGLRTEVAGTVAISGTPNVSVTSGTLGRNSIDGQGIQQSQICYNTGFRANIIKT